MNEPEQQPAHRGLLRRTLGSLWLRIAVTVALLAIVGTQIDWTMLQRRVSGGHPADFAGAVALLVAALAVGAWRWQLLLRAAGIVLAVPRLLRVYAISTFSTTFLPTTVGGDVARALLVARSGPLLTRTAVTVLVDRAAALGGLIGVAWLAFALDPGQVPAGVAALLGWITLGTAAAAAFAVATVLRGAGIARRVVPQRLLRTARETHSMLDAYARSPLLLAGLFLLSLVFQALIAMQLVMLARAIEVDLPFATAAVALAIVTIITLIPLSIGGFGLREGSYVVLLGTASIAATDATLVSVLSVAALLFASLPGAYLLARGGVSPALETVSR